MVKIRLSAGHGSGKAFNRGGLLFNEGDENKNFTDLMISAFKKYDVDVNEIRREKGNKDFSLDERAKYGNGADLFYSSHSNAGSAGATGVEIILSYQSKKYLNFANKLCFLISQVLGIKNRGVKFRNFNTGNFENASTANEKSVNWYGELRGNTAKCAMIIEHFFHTNETDSRAYLKNKERLAIEITKLIASEFGIKEKQMPQKTVSQSTNQVKVVSGKYELLSDVKVYKTSGNARTNRDSVGTYPKGSYFIYREFHGMLNITKKHGIPGAWINPKDNVLIKKKSDKDIAKEVINGLWGNGLERKQRLANAGYDASKIQAIVNKMI